MKVTKGTPRRKEYLAPADLVVGRVYRGAASGSCYLAASGGLTGVCGQVMVSLETGNVYKCAGEFTEVDAEVVIR